MPSAPHEEGEDVPSPLDGVTVLDVTQVMAGAYATMLLADMGADVIKVERPGTGDQTRQMGVDAAGGESAAYQAVNRNKRGVTIDLKDETGAAVVASMAERADILVENFRPGTLDRLGLGYSALGERNPALVYCSISGFGSTGPRRHQGGFDLVAQGMSGILGLTGNSADDLVKAGVPVCDLNAAMFATHGILSAYIHRLRTGEGQFVDTSLLEAGIAYTVWESAIYFSSGEVARPEGTAHRLTAPYQVLRTADGHMTLGAGDDRNFAACCRALDLPDLLDDDRYDSAPTRLANRESLVDALEKTLSSAPSATWIRRLREAGVPCGPIYDMQQVFEDPQAKARDMVVELDHPVAGATRQIGVPVKLSRTPATIRHAAPLLGQHTREVLEEFGFSPGVVDRVVGQGSPSDAQPAQPGKDAR